MADDAHIKDWLKEKTKCTIKSIIKILDRSEVFPHRAFQIDKSPSKDHSSVIYSPVHFMVRLIRILRMLFHSSAMVTSRKRMAYLERTDG